jgi:hypothetical protein
MLRFDLVSNDLKKVYYNYLDNQRENDILSMKDLEKDHEFCELVNFIIESLTEKASKGINQIKFDGYDVNTFWGTTKNGNKCKKNVLNECTRYMISVIRYFRAVGIHTYSERDTMDYVKTLTFKFDI